MLNSLFSGIMRFADGSLHFYLDGVDQGLACSGVASHVYAVVDLYGQCAQVSITQQPGGNGDSIAMMDDWRQQQQNVAVNVGSETLPANSQAPPDTCHRYFILASIVFSIPHYVSLKHTINN